MGLAMPREASVRVTIDRENIWVVGRLMLPSGVRLSGRSDLKAMLAECVLVQKSRGMLWCRWQMKDEEEMEKRVDIGLGRLIW